MFHGAWQQDPVHVSVPSQAFNPWQAGKGIVVLLVLVILFLEGSFPRDLAALTACGALLTSRRLHTREMLSLVDWPLLVLFAGLFIVNHALVSQGLLAIGLDYVSLSGIDLNRPAWLFGVTAVLSNLVSNVPAVMLLLPAANHPQSGAILALASTLAGNFVIVGSIANTIVLDQAARLNVRITWRDHARVGIPVTLATLTIAAVWLWIRSAIH
jgi:Na+/H+ antiporter NhaD/arsenite permease-like protein